MRLTGHSCRTCGRKVGTGVWVGPREADGNSGGVGVKTATELSFGRRRKVWVGGLCREAL